MGLLRRLLPMNSDEVRADNERNARALKAPDIFKDLISSSNMTPETADAAVNEFVRSGSLSIPAYQRKVGGQPQSSDVAQADDVGGSVDPGFYRTVGGNPDPGFSRAAPGLSGGASDTEPVSFRPKRKALYSYNERTGQFSQADVPEGVTDFQVEKQTPAEDGSIIYVDKATGKQIRREPSGEKGNKVVEIGAGGEGGLSLEQRTAMGTMHEYLDKLGQKDKLGNPVPVPDDLARLAETAAPVLGMDMETVTANPESAMNKILRMVPGVGNFLAGPAPANYKRPVFPGGGSPAKPSLAQGKQLDPETAKAYFQKAGGDKEKARQMAKADGWTF